MSDIKDIAEVVVEGVKDILEQLDENEELCEEVMSLIHESTDMWYRTQLGDTNYHERWAEVKGREFNSLLAEGFTRDEAMCLMLEKGEKRSEFIKRILDKSDKKKDK